MNVLYNNMYQDFIFKYNADLKYLVKRFLCKDEKIILVDLDKYDKCKDIKKSILLTQVKRLPDYARSKVTDLQSSKEQFDIVAIRHLGLCLISYL